MTTELYPGWPVYKVSGIGPYAINHEFTKGAMLPKVVIDGSAVALLDTEFSVNVEEGDTGNLSLTPAAAAKYAGLDIVLTRETVREQGWLGKRSAAEAGLEKQNDRTMQAVQDNRWRHGQSIRADDPYRLDPISIPNFIGHMMVVDADGQIRRTVHTTAEIENAAELVTAWLKANNQPEGTLLDEGLINSVVVDMADEGLITDTVFEYEDEGSIL